MKRASRFLPVAVAAILATARFAHAEPVNPDFASVIVTPSKGAPVVAQGSAGFDSSGIAAAANAISSKGPSGTPSGDTGPTFTYVPIRDNTIVGSGGPPEIRGGFIVKPPAVSQPACPQGQTGYYVYDANGQFVGIVCVPDTAPTQTTPLTSPEIALAEQASSRQPWPKLTVAVSPDRGVTGLDSWFWLAGNAAMPQASATAGSLTVTVRAALIDALWEFGDGSRIDSGHDLGQPYPQRSTIRHVFQTDSYQRPNGYQVLATLRFGVWYSVNSSPWRFLGTKAKGYSLPYAVYQIQPEGVPAKP